MKHFLHVWRKHVRTGSCRNLTIQNFKLQMRLLIQIRYINSVFIILKWSKVESSEEKIIRPHLLNKNQSQGRLNRETMRAVKNWGRLVRGGGGQLVKNPFIRTQGIFL